MPVLTSAQTGAVLARREFGEDREATVAVVDAVVAASGASMTELPPLESVIDTDSLDDLFGDGTSTGTVLFDYCGYVVCVHSAGRVSVLEPV